MCVCVLYSPCWRWWLCSLFLLLSILNKCIDLGLTNNCFLFALNMFYLLIYFNKEVFAKLFGCLSFENSLSEIDDDEWFSCYFTVFTSKSIWNNPIRPLSQHQVFLHTDCNRILHLKLGWKCIPKRKTAIWWSRFVWIIKYMFTYDVIEWLAWKDLLQAMCYVSKLHFIWSLH